MAPLGNKNESVCSNPIREYVPKEEYQTPNIGSLSFMKLLRTPFGTSLLMVAAAFLAVASPVCAQLSTGTRFSQQGSLTDGSQPANGQYDFQFALFTASTGGSQVNAVQTITNVTVIEGIYSVTLDFGEAFSGAERWLEIRVRPAGGPQGYTTLTPRRPLTPVPYALFAGKAQTAVETEKASRIDSEKADLGTVSNGNVTLGQVDINGPNSVNTTITGHPNNLDFGNILLRNSSGATRLDMSANPVNIGFISALGSNGTRNVAITAPDSNRSHGMVVIYNDDSSTTDIVAEILSVPDSGGRVRVYDVNGNTRNAVMEARTDDNRHGYMAVFDRDNNAQAGMFVDTSKRGVIFYDLDATKILPEGKSVEHRYSRLIGPEVGLYARGTVKLTDGRATVELPTSFSEVALPGTVTAHLTPMDAASQGLAVVQLTPQTLEIRELQNGTGSYSVQYLVLGERNDVTADKNGEKIPGEFENGPASDRLLPVE